MSIGALFKHKGYLGRPVVDPETMTIRGEVANTRDVVTFHGKTVEEASQAFRDSVDDYLAFCATLGVAPEKPFSGRFVIRTEPEIHRALTAIAQAEGRKLADITRRALRREVRKSLLNVSNGGTKTRVGPKPD